MFEFNITFPLHNNVRMIFIDGKDIVFVRYRLPKDLMTPGDVVDFLRLRQQVPQCFDNRLRFYPLFHGHREGGSQCTLGLVDTAPKQLELFLEFLFPLLFRFDVVDLVWVFLRLSLIAPYFYLYSRFLQLLKKPIYGLDTIPYERIVCRIMDVRLYDRADSTEDGE